MPVTFPRKTWLLEKDIIILGLTYSYNFSNPTTGTQAHMKNHETKKNHEPAKTDPLQIKKLELLVTNNNYEYCANKSHSNF